MVATFTIPKSSRKPSERYLQGGTPTRLRSAGKQKCESAKDARVAGGVLVCIVTIEIRYMPRYLRNNALSA